MADTWARWDAMGAEFVAEAGVPRARWAGAGPLFALRHPALVEGSPVDGWPAVAAGGPRRWSKAYLSEHVRKLKGVRVKREGDAHPDFLYHADLANKTELDAAWRPAFVEHNLTAADFFALCDGRQAAARSLGGEEVRPAAGGGLYFSAVLQRLRRNTGAGGAPLLDDVGGDEELYAGVDPAAAANPSRHLWAGAGGVSATAHYDAVHNLYVQLDGRKRFVLLPPFADRVLYTYPRLHPSARHTQVNFSAPDRARFPDFFGRDGLDTLLRGYDVVLSPGDVLYIPPYWFHHASAVDTSVSVSLWTDAEELATMKEAVRSPVRLRRGMSDADRRTAAAELVARFLRRWRQVVVSQAGAEPELWEALAPPSPRELVAHIVRARYGNLRREGAGGGGGGGSDEAPPLGRCRLDPSDEVARSLEARAQEAAVAVVRRGRDMGRADFRGVAEIHAADFVENVLHAMVGARGVLPLLQSMLATCSGAELE